MGVRSNIENSGHAGMSILTGTSSVGAVRFGDSGDNDIGMISYSHDNNHMLFFANAVERLRIASNGEVSINDGQVGTGAAVFKIKGAINNDVAIFEAVHGTAPDIVGKGTANPTALYLASAMMLDHVDEKKMADSLRKAIRETLKNKENRTSDLGGSASTEKYTSLVISNLN